MRCVAGIWRGTRGEGLVKTRILWNIFPVTQFLSNFLGFTQYLISTVINLLNVRGQAAHHRRH
jgi:hypothetical protein